MTFGQQVAPDPAAAAAFDVLLINALDVLAHGDKKYAVQFMNKFHATYTPYAQLRSTLPVDAIRDAAMQEHVTSSFLLAHAADEPFFTEQYQFLPLFEKTYLLACELIIMQPRQACLPNPAYERVWAGHQKLMTLMETMLYAVSSPRTRALLTVAGLTGSPA